MANGYPAAGYKWSLAMLITMTSISFWPEYIPGDP